MVSIVAGIIGLVLLIIVGLVAINFIGTSIVDLTQQGQDFLDALKIDITPVAGERVCDLSIILSGGLTEGFFSVIVDNVQKQYQWFDCHDSTSVPFFSLFNSNDSIEIFRENLALLTFGEYVLMQDYLMIHSNLGKYLFLIIFLIENMILNCILIIQQFTLKIMHQCNQKLKDFAKQV